MEKLVESKLKHIKEMISKTYALSFDKSLLPRSRKSQRDSYEWYCGFQAGIEWYSNNLKNRGADNGKV